MTDLRHALAAMALLVLTACGEPTENIDCTDYRVQVVWTLGGGGDWYGPHAQRICVMSESKMEAPK